MRLLFDWEYGVFDRIVCCTDALSAKTLLGYGEVVVGRIPGSLPDLTDRSVLELAGPVVEALPERFEGIFFMGGGRSFVGVGDRNGRSAVGVVDGDIKATFLFCTSTVIAVVVVIVVAFETLLEFMGSGSWGAGVRVEGTASGSAGLGGGKVG